MMFRKIPALLTVAAISLCLSATAVAQDTKIFLNGVDITGVTNQEFENATIKIDNQGNVIIDAPQYKVEVQDDDGTTQPAPGALTGSYFLVGNNTSPGKPQYDIEIFVNGVMVKTMKNTDPQLVVDITDKLEPGINTVSFKALKDTAGSRTSVSGSDKMEIFVGKGSASSNKLTIDKQLLTFSVNASQTENVSKNFTFEAD